MSLQKLSDALIAWVIREVAAYIGKRRQAYRQHAVPLDGIQRTAMQPFFPALTLDSARIVVLSGKRVGNPLFYGELIRMGFEFRMLPDFALMTAITFIDTVVSHKPLTDRVLFHELVHVVQYEKLGLPEFSAKYVKGFLKGGCYEAIPLEKNAYQLDSRFAASPAKAFSVPDEVQAWIDAGRF